jgi:flavodoxin/ferredoxin
MRTLIIHFSQTGNTRVVAEQIRDGVVETTGQADLKALKDVTGQDVQDYDLVGLGCPVFYYQEPFNVADFILGLPGLNGQHWFVFCTHGNVIGATMTSMSEKLRKKGAVVVGHFNSYANITVPFYPRPSFTSGHPDGQDLEQAKEFGRHVAALSPRIDGPDSPLVPEPGPVSSPEWLEDAARITPEQVRKMMPALRWDPDLCQRCGVCEENCPVGGIDLEADPPRLQDPCIFCWRCVNVCAELAISADWDGLVARAPAFYERYRRELERAEARGEFRWLIDPDRIDPTESLFGKLKRARKRLQD